MLRKTVQPASRSMEAHQRIKKQIVSLQLPPGAIIVEADLQRALGLGRTPIREALQRLAQERLVVVLPRRGMFVADIGITDLQRLFEMRLVLEDLAVRLAAQRGTESHWRRMEEALDAMPLEDGEANGNGVIDNEALIAIDEICHEIIYDAADNVFLRDTLVTTYALSLRLWYFSLSRIGDMRNALAEHRRILDALRAGDADESARLMRQHIQAFQAEIQAELIDRGLG
jgi:DNA-binding GntR family transcriptional regulator